MLTTSAAPTAVAGRDYTTLYTVDPHGASGARIGVKAIRSDASAIIVSSPAGQVVAQSRVGIQIGQARTWFPLQTNMKFGQPFQVAAEAPGIAWLETNSKDISYQGTKVFAVVAGQAKPIMLGDAVDQTKTNLTPWPRGSTIITTDGVHAWWTMPYMTKKIQGGWAARIMVRDIAGHEPLKIAVDKAKLPVAAAGGVEYVRSEDVDPSMPAGRYEIRLLKGGKNTLITSGPLVKGEQVSGMCASNSHVAWSLAAAGAPRQRIPAASTGGRLHVMTLAMKAQKIVLLNDDAGGISLSCGDSFIAWGNGSGKGDPGQYVLDLPSSKIWKLGQAQGISLVRAAGNILAWALPPKSQEAAPWRVSKWHGQDARIR
jgi:hypothetical protein